MPSSSIEKETLGMASRIVNRERDVQHGQSNDETAKLVSETFRSWKKNQRLRWTPLFGQKTALP
jgi:hypothetical protein